jgi:hypothetical protein
VRFSEEMNDEQEDKVDEGRRIPWRQRSDRERQNEREIERERERENGRGANNVSVSRSVSRSLVCGARGMKDVDV